MYPTAAAEYEYSRHAFPQVVAFLVGWVMIAGLTVAAAAVSLGFAQYATLFLDVDERILSLGLLAVLTLIALAGLEYSARLTVVLALIQVAGLLVVIAIGIPHLGEENLFEGNGATGILGASALVFFAFIGFDEVITLAEETENPRRTVPLALLVGLGGSTLLYVAVAITTVSVLGAETLGASERPLADVLATAIGGAAESAIAVVAMVATTNTTLLALTAASRITYGMAVRSAFPAAFARVTRNSRTPFVAVAASAVVAAAFALIGDLRLIASTTDVAVYLVFIAVNLTVIILRVREPAALRPFRSPLSIGSVPVLPILGIGATALMMSGLERGSWLLGAVLVVAGIAVGLILRPDVPPPAPRGKAA